jgi:putative copper resistance protein D
VDDALVVVRGVHFAATAITAGALIFVAVVAHRAFGAADAIAVGIAFKARSQTIGWVGLAIAMISGVAWVALQASAMSGLPLDEALTTDVLWIVVSKTHFGMVSDFRLALAVLLAVSLPLVARWTRWVPPALGTALAATIAWTGHAAATVGFVGTFHLAADALHVLASAAWIGGLVPLAILLATATHGDNPTWAMIIRDATLRFSKLGIVSVATLLATGIVNAWVLVGSFAALARTDYGLLVLVKIALFSAMLSLAMFNRLQLTSRLFLPFHATLRKEALHQLTRNSVVEIVIGLAVFAIVAVLGTLHPAIHLLPP